MPYELALMANWLLAALGMMASLVPAEWFEDDADDGAGEAVNSSFGSTEDDILTGTEGADDILALAGNDQVDGLDGNDTIEGNTGDDTLTGGAGNDFLAGGGDTDTIFGGAGDDLLSSDRIDGDADFERGDAEVLDGGEGDDRLVFSMDDIATGGAGADQFDMVIGSGGAAHVTDFDPGEDAIAIYADLSVAAPEVTFETDTDANTTTVLLDGNATVTFDGIFSEAELSVELLDKANLSFD